MQGVLAACPPSHIGMAARGLLNYFQFRTRFVDDCNEVANPYSSRLTYTDQTVMGGMIKGLYNRAAVTLKAVEGSPTNLHTLDMRILTREVPRPDSIGGMILPGVAWSWTVPFDKRSLPCYAGIDFVRYSHISSTTPVSTAYNTLKGLVTKASRICMEEEDFVLQIARILYYMIHESGFQENTLATVLKRQLARLRGKNCVALANAALHDRILEKLQWLKQHPGRQVVA